MARNPAALPNSARIATETAKCFELKLKDYSVRRIAAELKMAPTTVQDRLQAAYDDLVKPVAEEVKALELERLSTWVARLEDRLDDGEDPVRVVPILLKVQERRSKLLGLDAPVQIDATVTETTQQDIELQELLREAKVAQSVEEARIRGEGTR